MAGMEIITILVGAVLLLAGRKLFWAFIAILGFVIGMNLAAQLFTGLSEWMAIFVGLVCGGLGAMLAIFLYRLAVTVGGFLAGAYILPSLLDLLNISPGEFGWVLALVGGILGAILISSLFDIALMLLSTISGALMISQAFDLRAVLSALVFVALFLIGFIIQERMYREDQLRGLR